MNTSLNSTSSAPPPGPTTTQTPAVPTGAAGTDNSQQSVPIDINTILTQLKAVEGDREQLLQKVQEMQAKISKLTEGKKAEMQKALDTVIGDWAKATVQDEKLREEFMGGLCKLVEQTAEENGVWQVVCQASSRHAESLRELESMRTQLEGFKSGNTAYVPANVLGSTGTFQDESSRKRNINSISQSTEPNKELSIWEEFAVNMKGRTYEPTL